MGISNDEIIATLKERAKPVETHPCDTCKHHKIERKFHLCTADRNRLSLLRGWTLCQGTLWDPITPLPYEYETSKPKPSFFAWLKSFFV